MARNNFKLIGKIQLGKETEKFKPYKVSKSAKGWIGHRLSFGLKNITGFHNLELFAGYMEDGTSLIYCIQKKENYSDEIDTTEEDEDGNPLYDEDEANAIDLLQGLGYVIYKPVSEEEGEVDDDFAGEDDEDFGDEDEEDIDEE